jgi:hypothetical protein
MLGSRSRTALTVVSTAALCLFLPQARSQESQAQSVAEAAARAKEAKKKASAKTKVISDDDLDAKRVKPGEQGLTTPTPQLETGPPPATAVAAQEAADAAKEKSPPDAPVQKGDSPEVVRLKADLARAEQDLDISKREAALAQDTYYSNPDHSRDTAGKAKIDALQQQVNDKQQAVQVLKDRLSALHASPQPPSPPGQAATPPQE